MTKENFWKLLGDMHFYKSKGEGLFKAVAITFSWCGGVNVSELSNKTELTNTIAAGLYLFAIALIMEYVVQLVTADRFIYKIVPALITIPSIIVFLVSGSALLDHTIEAVPIQWVFYATILPQVIIWLDVLTQILIEVPKNKLIENSLQHFNVEGRNE